MNIIFSDRFTFILEFQVMKMVIYEIPSLDRFRFNAFCAIKDGIGDKSLQMVESFTASVQTTIYNYELFVN